MRVVEEGLVAVAPRELLRPDPHVFVRDELRTLRTLGFLHLLVLVLDHAVDQDEGERHVQRDGAVRLGGVALTGDVDGRPLPLPLPFVFAAAVIILQSSRRRRTEALRSKASIPYQQSPHKGNHLAEV